MCGRSGGDGGDGERGRAAATSLPAWRGAERHMAGGRRGRGCDRGGGRTARRGARRRGAMGRADTGASRAHPRGPVHVRGARDTRAAGAPRSRYLPP